MSTNQQNETNGLSDKRKSKYANCLPEKFFENRDSILRNSDVVHINTLHNFAIALFFGIFGYNLVHNYVKNGEFNFGPNYLTNGFAKFHFVLIVWLWSFLVHLLTYPVFKYWANQRIVSGIPSDCRRTPADNFFLILTIIYYSVCLGVPAYAVMTLDLPFLSSVSVLCETIRFVMKSHAFIRSSVPKVLSFKPHSDQDFPVAKFSHFLYFSFVPTLVYRDEYPRTSRIRWNFVGKCFLEFFMAMVFMNILAHQFGEKFFDVCLVEKHWHDIPLSIIRNALFGTSLAMVFFYMFLDSWLNAFGEMLMFGDRLFYKDWWTSSSYQRYYRTWNVVVHDWLYTYILKDFYEIITPKNMQFAKFIVFFISAVFHEYILTFALRSFFPVLTVQYLMSTVLFMVTKETRGVWGNIFFMYTYGLGLSLQIMLYGYEYMARENCENGENSFWSIPIPKFVSCKCFI